jgi:hypothetical protein
MNNDKEMSEEDKVTPALEEQSTAGISTEPAPEASAAHTEDHLLEDEHPTDEEEAHVDYSDYSKIQLLKALKEVVETGNLLKIESAVNEIKSHYDDIFNKEKSTALEQYKVSGGAEDDFQYRPDEEDREFFGVYHNFKTKKTEIIKDLEKQKEKNLIAKNQILDKLRELVDGEETTSSISSLKQLQEEWKKIGPVPGAQNRNLWASYNALMDRFYDNRSIYFELKELDRKKNLEHKLEICEKAEALASVPELKEAIKTLNDLHEEFKHIGPVPREEQEKLWQRFKAASDAVYNKRKNFFEGQKEVFKENQVAKEKLIEKLEEYKDFSSSKIKEWNFKTKEVLALQKEWEGVGPVPKESGKEINKKFWSHFKQFFHNKNHFFKELDEIRLSNKNKAEELIEKAEALKDNTDWQDTASKMVALQQEWKTLGPTPEKVRDELYSRFKVACDSFFDNRRNANKQVNKEFDLNLKAKEEVIARILVEAANGNQSTDNLEQLILEFNKIGFVPRKNMKDIIDKFNTAVDTYVKQMGIEGGDKDEFLFRLNLNKLQADPNGNRVLNKKEHGIRKQITDLENNVTLWKNNLEFFAASKTADKLRDQFEEKIQKAEVEIDKLKKRLSILREF